MERNKMKLSRYFLFSCMLVFMACSNDEILNDESTQEKSMITAIGNLPSGANTRMSCNEQDTESGKQLVVSWGNSETIGVTDGSTSTWYFSHSGSAGTSATFKPSVAISASEDEWFYAVYPADLMSGATQANLSLNFLFGKGYEFKAILWSKAQLKDNTLNFTFDYLNSVLKIKFRSFKDDVIDPYITSTTSYSLLNTQIVLKASTGLYSSVKLDMKSGELSDKQSVTMLPLYSVEFIYNADTKATTVSDIYQSFFPEEITDFRVCLELVDCIYEAKVTSSYTFKVGKFYFTDDLIPTKVGFILAKTDMNESVYNEATTKTIDVKEVLRRITERDTDCGNSDRKVMRVISRGWSSFRDSKGSTFLLDTGFKEDEFAATGDYLDGTGFTGQASILGNWLRTKGTSVEFVDMRESCMATIPASMFYGCSKETGVGNSALEQIMLTRNVETIGENAFAKSGIKEIVCFGSSLTSVTKPFGEKEDMSDINLYLPELDDAEQANTIRNLFKVGESMPTVYYGFNGDSQKDEDYFNIANYTKLE